MPKNAFHFSLAIFFLLPPLTMKLIQYDLKMTEGHIFVYYVPQTVMYFNDTLRRDMNPITLIPKMLGCFVKTNKNRMHSFAN